MGPYRAFRQGESAALAAPALSWSLVILRVSFSTWTATLHYKDRPPGASMAARISEGKGSGVRMSVFSLGGSLGWAIGPLIAVGLVGWIGMEKLWVAMFPGILLALVIYPLLPPGRRASCARLPPSPRKLLRHLRGPLGRWGSS